MLKRMFFKRLVSKMIEDEFLDDDAEEDAEDPLGPMLGGGGPRRGAMKFFKPSRRSFVSLHCVPTVICSKVD